jgi:ribosomal protein S12 methylthiotransferase
MNRGHDRKRLEDLLFSFREHIPDVALRTTLLVGFPGETEEEFNELCGFVRDFRFDRLGVFPYSHEEDTPAATLEDNIPLRVKEERAEKVMSLQQDISLELNRSRIGKVYKVLIDYEETGVFTGRTQYDSPEVDNEVLVEMKPGIKTGEFQMVRITGAGEYYISGVSADQ